MRPAILVHATFCGIGVSEKAARFRVKHGVAERNVAVVRLPLPLRERAAQARKVAELRLPPSLR